VTNFDMKSPKKGLSSNRCKAFSSASGSSQKVFRRTRSQLGGQIAELGPALFLLLIVMFFPLLDLIRLGLAFGAGWYLNQIEARAVAVSPPPLGGPGGPFNGLMINEVQVKENAFMQVLGPAFGLQDLSCQVTQAADPAPADPTIVTKATVTNVISVAPYLLDQWYLNVQGVNAFNFTYTTTETQEERGLN
jgi:hypothetical protein